MEILQQLLSRPLMSGYGGPLPGSQEFQDARMAGEHPIRDYIREQQMTGLPVMPQPNGNTGIVPPKFNTAVANGGPVLPMPSDMERRYRKPIQVVAQ
jgi:hypothetical protein